MEKDAAVGVLFSIVSDLNLLSDGADFPVVSAET